MRNIVLALLVLAIGACSDTELMSMQQLSSGAKLYETHCSNCHQEDGSGLAMLIPPLKHSDYLQEHFYQLPCIIKKGMEGEIKVNGQSYHQKMPGNEKLTKKEISDICLFVLQKFPERPITIGSDSIEKALKTCVSNSY